MEEIKYVIMCGIFGCINFNSKIIDSKLFKESLHLLNHRGPDNQDVIYYKNDTVALGHTRLSIIDLSSFANQPMHIGNYCIVFNGEIYNYIEIRSDLIKKGFSFITDSDTEVIIKAYEFYGEDCVNKFNGMWAFVIYDLLNDSYFCSRDRFGVKPFNYYYSDKRFLFSSEIKAILNYDYSLASPNFNSIGLYCLEGASSELSETWFNDIYRLMPGHNLLITGNKIEIKRYYSYPIKTDTVDYKSALIDFREQFLDAVKLRMRSDVKVGVTLSGGLDSASIVSALSHVGYKDLNTYTASFPNYKYDEYVTADKVNKEFNLNGNKIEVSYSNEEYIPILKKMIYHLESGNLSPSIFPLWKVYESAKKDVTVVLEGQGADELLAGYMTTFSSYFLLDLLRLFKFKLFFIELYKIFNNYSFRETLVLFIRTNFSFKVRSIIRRFFLKQDNVLSDKLRYAQYTYNYTYKSKSILHNALQKSHQTTLSNLLHYGDAISMAFSIENRLPFLDYRLVNFAFKLPITYYISGGKGKFIQREALKNMLPTYIYRDKRKLGFPSPINTFLFNNKQLLKDILLSSICINRGLFENSELEKLINSDFTDSTHIPRFLFRLLSVELWFNIYVDNKLKYEN